MVDALASDRSDQPFGEAVLPRRAWGDGLVADAHGAQSVRDGSAIDAILITDQVARREPDATPHPALQHNQLMTERRALGLKSALRLERRDGQGQEEEEERDHRR